MTIHPSFQWKGRHDGDGTAHLRFHHLVGQSPTATYTLIGFASDEGVRRNHGRIGASLAPDAIRTQFSNLPVHQSISISDWGTIYCEDAALEAAQEQLATAVDACLQQGSKPVVIGGGHEVAFGSFSGLFRHVLNQDLNKKVGVINFDAHFDLREATQVTSGTPFYDAAMLSAKHGQEFHYLCLGVAKHSNTQALFETAERLHCDYLFDHELNSSNLDVVLRKIDTFIARVDELYITIDLDVFHASIAPGVSAPAVKGIDLTIFEPLLQRIKASGKVKVLDVAECNPNFDLDHRTARLAAYIIYLYMTD